MVRLNISPHSTHSTWAIKALLQYILFRKPSENTLTSLANFIQSRILPERRNRAVNFLFFFLFCIPTMSIWFSSNILQESESGFNFENWLLHKQASRTVQYTKSNVCVCVFLCCFHPYKAQNTQFRFAWQPHADSVEDRDRMSQVFSKHLEGYALLSKFVILSNPLFIKAGC